MAFEIPIPVAAGLLRHQSAQRVVDGRHVNKGTFAKQTA
jgi:hypothetical protein